MNFSPSVRYVPLMAIGRGGMGRVDLALAVGLPGAEQLVVLKRLREPAEQTAEARRELVREAHLSARLMHANVAATLGLDVLGEELVLVLEYLEGATLSTLVRRCQEKGLALPVPILLRVVRDALAGLGYAHDLCDYDGSRLGIVHRDVSPSNVLVTTDGITKVLDFGIAKATSRSTTVTPPGFVKGKLGYMPPEQLVGHVVDQRADLYAVGVILWEGLTGRRFASTADLDACLALRIERDAPNVRSVAGDVPASLDEVVQSCLARNPRDRWSSASLLRAALDAHVAMHGGDATTQDVARFVAEHCGDALQARRVFLRDRFSQLAAPTTRTLRMPAHGDRHSTSPVAVDVSRLRASEEWSASPSAVVHGAVARRGLARWSMPTLALIVGAGLSVAVGEVRERMHSRPAAPASVRTARGAESVSASRSDGSRAKADRTTATTATTTTTEAPSHTKGSVRGPTTSPASDEPSAPAAELPAPATGFATIDSYPWARVTIDGSDVGVTPVVRAPLRAGAHVVVLENPAQGRHELTLTVREGETTAERWRW